MRSLILFYFHFRMWYYICCTYVCTHTLHGAQMLLCIWECIEVCGGWFWAVWSVNGTVTTVYYPIRHPIPVKKPCLLQLVSQFNKLSMTGTACSVSYVTLLSFNSVLSYTSKHTLWGMSFEQLCMRMKCKYTCPSMDFPRHLIKNTPWLQLIWSASTN